MQHRLAQLRKKYHAVCDVVLTQNDRLLHSSCMPNQCPVQDPDFERYQRLRIAIKLLDLGRWSYRLATPEFL